MEIQFYERFPRRNHQYMAILAVSMSGYSLGAILGWAAPADKIMQVDGMEVNKLLHVISIAYLGAAISQVYLACTFQIIGRKLHLILASLPLALFWIVMGIYNNFYVYLVGRFFLGFGGSLFFVLGPTFIVETVEVHLRPPSIVLFQLMLSLGVVSEFILGLDENRKTLCFPSAVPPLLVLVMMIYLRDTPSAFMARGNYISAGRSLHFYRGKHFNIAREFDQIERHVDNLGGINWLGDIYNHRARKGVAILIICHTMQQLSGINLILLYNTDIIELASPKLNSPISTVIFGGFFVFAWVVSMLLSRQGRILLWRLSTGGMAVSTSILTAYFYVLYQKELDAKNLSYLPLIGVCCFSFAFAIGAGPLPFIMTADILPTDAKIRVGCLLTAYNCLLAYVIIVGIAIAREHIQESHIFLGHTLCNFMGFVYALFFMSTDVEFGYGARDSDDSIRSIVSNRNF